jgi:transcriptional regulator with XRE-family HTH domain
MKGMTIGEELRKRRVMAGLSIGSVAAACGFNSPRRLSEYERGVHVPREKTRERILDAIRKLDKRTDANKEVRKMLNGICNRMDVTLSEVGRRIGADRAQLSRWYNGRSLPGEKDMEALKSLYAESVKIQAAKDVKIQAAKDVKGKAK